jgi:hypothetical protein
MDRFYLLVYHDRYICGVRPDSSIIYVVVCVAYSYPLNFFRYGDFTPGTDSTIWFSVFFIPLAVGIMSAQLGRIANIFVEREISKANTKLLNREVTIEDLEAMNADGDGDVSPLEFVEHMLLVMNKVDQQLLNELHAQFRHLDADGSGGLQQDDLEILTNQKLTEYRTRALKKYKDNLLDPSMVASMPTRGFSPIFPS